MYKVTLINDGQETIIHNPFTGGNKLMTGVIKFEINKVGQFDFQFLPNNAAHASVIRPFLTKIEIINELTGKEVFCGRIGPFSKDMVESGITTFTYNARDELDYLNDSKQQPEIYKGTRSGLIKKILDYHNSIVESYKAFFVGDIADFVGNSDKIECEIDANKKTLALITDLILNAYSLEIQIRRVEGKRYIDIKRKIGVRSSTEIKLMVNLVRNSQKLNPDNVITRLIPLGKRDEASGHRLTIASVNDGKTYVDRADLISEIGIRADNLVIDDETDPKKLKSSAESVMNSQKATASQYTLEAINLNLIKKNFDEFVEGNTYRVINPIMNLDEDLRIVSRQIDISKVEKSTLTVGDKFKTAEEYQAEMIKARTSSLVSKEALADSLSTIMNETAKLSEELERLKTSTPSEEETGGI